MPGRSHPVVSESQPLLPMMHQSLMLEGGHFEHSPSYQVLRPRRDLADGHLKPYTEFMECYSEEKGFGANEAWSRWEASQEPDPPLLETKYRLGRGREMNFDVDHELARVEPEHFIVGNSSPGFNCAMKALSWLLLPLGGPCLHAACVDEFEVPVGAVRKVEDGNGGFALAGAGVHWHCNPFWRVAPENHRYSEGVLVHGDWCLAVIEQGYIGLAMDKGQPVLLPPGLHQWRSTTLRFERVIDLNEPVIYLGPFTLLTVDEGYAAVTQNNGRQEIKGGGKVHLLSHRNHKFEKFLSTKIQTDDLARIEVITADNVLMLVDATVNWRIADVERAARNAAETMAHTAGQSGQPRQSRQSPYGDITKLRNDILKQASASLSSFIGTVNYSDTFGPAAQVHNPPVAAVAGVPVPADECGGGGNAGLLFDVERMQDAVGHANQVTQQYGVQIMSINIISAKPADDKLMGMLAKGAVAAAEAQQLETTAQGRGRAVRIEAQANAEVLKVEASARAECVRIQAKADADADEERARGAKNAADLIGQSQVAVELAKIDKTGAALGHSKSTLIMGRAPGDVGGMLLANPNLLKD